MPPVRMAHAVLEPSAIRPGSFPLDGSRRFRGDVIGDPVDALDLVDDARGGFAEEVVAERVVIGCHAVDAGDGAQGAGVEDALVAMADVCQSKA